MTLCCIAAIALNTFAQSRPSQKTATGGQQQKGLTAEKILSLGDYYFRSNDITDAADRYYKQVVNSYPGTQAAGFAQYNRGSYWFRKYYIVKEQYGKEDKSALVEAEGQYYDFIDKYAAPTGSLGLLSDAEFYLALVYLQQGKKSYATGWLNKIIGDAARRDRTVNVYKLVWTPYTSDVIDRNLDARELALFTSKQIEKGLSFDQVIAETKRWCQKQ